MSDDSGSSDNAENTENADDTAGVPETPDAGDDPTRPDAAPASGDASARPFLVRRHREAVIVLAGLVFGVGLVAANEDPYEDNFSPSRYESEGEVHEVTPFEAPNQPNLRVRPYEGPSIDIEDIPMPPDQPPPQVFTPPDFPTEEDFGGSVQTVPAPIPPDDFPMPSFEDPYEDEPEEGE